MLCIPLCIGTFLNQSQQKTEDVWHTILTQPGFLDVHVEWASDARLEKETQLSGWAWISPISSNLQAQTQFKKKLWVRTQTNQPPVEHTLKYAHFITRTNVTGPDQRSFTLVFPSHQIHVPWHAKIRSKLLNYYNSNWNNLNPVAHSYCLSLLFGKRELLNSQTKHTFQRLGILPLLALSGMHIGIVFVFVYQCLKFCKVPIGICSACASLTILLYGCLGAWSPSLTRAVLMCLCFQVSLLIGRRYSLLNALCFCAFIEIIFNPKIIESVAFQLSYSGVAGILFVFQLKLLFFKDDFRKNSTSLLSSLGSAFLACCGAVLFTFPLSILYFETFPYLSWLLSFPITFLFSIVIILAMLTFLFSGISTIFVTFVNTVFGTFDSILIHTASHWSWIHHWPDFNKVFITPYYLSLIIMILLIKNHQLKIKELEISSE